MNVASLPDTMRLTVLDQYAKGLVHCDQTLGEEIRQKIERLKWSLWHGNLSKAFYKRLLLDSGVLYIMDRA